jgi:hypothetical protein
LRLASANREERGRVLTTGDRVDMRDDMDGLAVGDGCR